MTKNISLKADLRIIWGGDNSVSEIKNYPSKPNCIDIVFPDRYSFCVIDLEFVQKNGISDGFYEKFYNDSLLFDQMRVQRLNQFSGLEKSIKRQLKMLKKNFGRVLKNLF